MANNVVGGLIVNLGLNTAQLDSDTQKASRHFRRFEKDTGTSLDRIKAGIVGLTGKVALMTAGLATAAVAGLGIMAKRSIDAADKIGKLSTRLGASTEALSEYKHVAELSGVTFETLTMGWQRMTRRVAEAANGTGEAVKALDEMNINAKELNKLKPEEQFEVLADALNGVENQADKVRLAMKLFDSEGVSLLQTMKDGSAGLDEMRESAAALGLTIGKDQAEAAEKAKDAMTRFQSTISGLVQTFTLDALPSITDFIDALAMGIPDAVNHVSKAMDFIGRQMADFWLMIGPEGGVGGGAKEMEDALNRQVDLVEKLAIAKDMGATGSIAKMEKELATVTLLIQKLQMQSDILKKEEQRRANAVVPAVPYEPQQRDPANLILGDGESNQTGKSEDDKAAKAAEAAAKEEARQKEAMTRKLDTLTTSLMTEEERLFESYDRRRALVDTAFENELLTEEAHKNILFKLENDFEDKKTALIKKAYTDREKFATMSSKSQTKHVISEAIRLTQGVTGESKKLFQINKVAGIANALINTYEGVTKTMAAYPYPLNIALASLSLAAGMAQVSAIKSQSFGGGGGAPSLAASGGTPSNPVIQSGDTGPTAAPVEDIRRLQVDITVDGTGQLDRAQAEEIARSLRDYIDDGGEAIAV